MRIATRVVVLFQLSTLTSVVFAADGFVFGGLSLQTTLEDAKKRYPRSTIVGRHVYVSDADAHDHVYGIDLPDGGTVRRLKVFFERSGSQGAEYPPCERLVKTIRTQYGEPSRVQEFDEERARNRRVSWVRGREELSLVCFRIGRQPFSASDLTITTRGND